MLLHEIVEADLESTELLLGYEEHVSVNHSSHSYFKLVSSGLCLHYLGMKCS